MSSGTRGWLLWGLATLVLSWPALWNGYALFFYDSMDYVRSAFTLTPAVYRSLPYSLFLSLPGQTGTLWSAVLLQAAIGAYILLELLRSLAPARGGLFFVGCLLALALGSGLPWFASQIMPDFFTAILVAGLGLLLLGQLPWWRRLLVALISLLALAAHASNLPTALMMALAGLLLAWVWRDLVRGSSAVQVLLLVLLGGLITPTSHYLATGDFYMSRNAPIMALARLIRDGEAQRYLEEVCPQAGLKFCDYRDQLRAGPNGANDFLWLRGSPFEQMGGWSAWEPIGAEAKKVVMGAWLAHPLSNLQAALHNWGEQLVRFGTGGGSGLGKDVWIAAPLRDVVLSYLPNDRQQLTSSHQYLEDLKLTLISVAHQWVLGLAMALGLLLALLKPLQMDQAKLFFWLVVLATLVNAAVTGIVSNPDERYQARLVWLFLPALWLLWSASRGRNPSEPADNSFQDTP